jgi:hypothetical protein
VRARPFFLATGYQRSHHGPRQPWGRRVHPAALVAADVDGDGVPDLGGGIAGQTIVLTGNGDGTFETAPSLPAAPSRLLALADLDNRPPLDIVGSTGAIYRAGSDTRTETWTITAAALSDADGDGHLDPFGIEGRAHDLSVLASQCR